MPEQPNPYVTSMMGHPANRTVMCSLCGALLIDHPDWTGLHTAFHEEVDELADWAKAVSLLFKANGGMTNGS